MAPMRRAEPSPPAQARGGITVGQWWVWAYVAVAAAPSPTPAAPPNDARSMASVRNWMRTCPLVAPNARRSPISERRSSTEISMRLPMQMAPTSRETAPRPRKRLFSAPSASACATSASEGWLTPPGTPPAARLPGRAQPSRSRSEPHFPAHGLPAVVVYVARDVVVWHQPLAFVHLGNEPRHLRVELQRRSRPNRWTTPCTVMIGRFVYLRKYTLT